MILLLGGTSDTPRIALRLAEQGHRVLVSKATEIPMDVGDDPRIECRSGPLDDEGLAELIDRHRIRALVDATHPYAQSIRARAARIAETKGIAYFSFLRPGNIPADAEGVEFAADYAAAAARAFLSGKPVLLTTGVRNLAPYVSESRRTGVRLVARVLDRPESIEACHEAGIADADILPGRGPFSVEENREHLHRFAIGVLVTKDSGQAGGTEEKLAAARAEGCRVVVVQRPAAGNSRVFTDIEVLLNAVEQK